MGYFTDYVLKTQQAQQAAVQPQQPLVTVPVQQPQVDTGNAIGSIAEMLGPTPAEREARERRAQESRAKMSAWAGLFDGLRQFGNLYYAYKGATPQQLSSPYQAIDNEINQQRAIADANDNYRRQYAQSLYNIRRQMSDDARRDMLAQAQADYYGTRDEVARMKAENDRLKNEKYIELQDGRIAKLNAETGQIEQLLPYKQQELESRTQRNRQTGEAAMIRANRVGTGGRSGGGRNNGTYGYKTTTYYDEQGRKVTERVPTTGGVPMRTVQEPKKPVQQPKKPSQTKANKQVRKGATNNSGFFNK